MCEFGRWRPALARATAFSSVLILAVAIEVFYRYVSAGIDSAGVGYFASRSSRIASDSTTVKSSLTKTGMRWNGLIARKSGLNWSPSRLSARGSNAICFSRSATSRDGENLEKFECSTTSASDSTNATLPFQ